VHGGRGCRAADGAAARRTGLLHGERGCCAADRAAARRTGLLRLRGGERGCCAADGAAARRTGLLRGGRGCSAADGAAAWRTGLMRGDRGCCSGGLGCADGTARTWRSSGGGAGAGVVPPAARVAAEFGAGVAAPAAVEVACRMVGSQICGRRAAGEKYGMYILSGGNG